MALLVIGLWTLAACSLGATQVENDEALDEQLASIQPGEEKRLHDLVPGNWTKVYIFDMDAVTRESVEEEVGHSVGMPDTYFSSGAILVFVNDKEVVRASAVFKARFAWQTGDTESVVAIDETTGLLVLK